MSTLLADDDKSEPSASIAYQELSPATSSRPSLTTELKYKTFKVCFEEDPYTRKVIRARSLKDLIRKGANINIYIHSSRNSFQQFVVHYCYLGNTELFGNTQFNKKLRVLLFDDDTEVDDEEYFQTLPEKTLFVFTKHQKAKVRSRYR